MNEITIIKKDNKDNFQEIFDEIIERVEEVPF
jgi:hypothetical protein